MKLVNLGCGNRYHKEWINLDFRSNSEYVQTFNLNDPLPFEDNSVDVVYHSHVLEHFSKCKAKEFLKECYRVLKPGGIIRVVVPNLEDIVINYLYYLNEARKGNKQAKIRYEWMMLEMYDQTVREYGGGEMLEFWKQNPLPEEDFIIKRVGSEVKNALKSIREHKLQPNKKCIEKLPNEVGSFRASGEVHKWMYDEFSLSELLKKIGFRNIVSQKADTSNIKNFNSYLLDTEADGSIRKPDSLFMEAIKK